MRNRCPVRASALSYTTLLALVPMLAVAMSVTSIFLKSEGKEQIAILLSRQESATRESAKLSAEQKALQQEIEQRAQKLSGLLEQVAVERKALEVLAEERSRLRLKSKEAQDELLAAGLEPTDKAPGPAAVFRIVPESVISADALGLPPAIASLAAKTAVEFGAVKDAFDTDETTGVPVPKTKAEQEAARKAYSPFAGKASAALTMLRPSVE